MKSRYLCPHCKAVIHVCSKCGKRMAFNKEIFCVRKSLHYCNIWCMSSSEDITRCKVMMSKHEYLDIDRTRRQAVTQVMKSI